MAEQDASWEASGEARLLLRAARMGMLATLAHKAGEPAAPFASLVTPATAPDGSVLLLLSDLAAHTRHLRQHAACALLLTGASGPAPNPQTIPRLTLTGHAAPEADPALRARFVALHPYAGLYAGFADFALWRFAPEAAHQVGGFGRARLRPWRSLRPDPAAVAAIEAAEADILAHMNADHAAALAVLGGADAAWRMVAADVDGFDLAPVAPAEAGGEAQTRRIAFGEPVADAAGFRIALIGLLAAARAP